MDKKYGLTCNVNKQKSDRRNKNCGRFLLLTMTRYICSKGTISNATMLIILMRGFTAGPAVSLYGSPTVSPVTAALCASEPLPP